MINKLTVVRADDWEGLFVNGTLVEEGHELHSGEHYLIYAKRVLDEYSPCEIESKWVTSVYYETYLAKYGGFPKSLAEVECDE